MSLILPRRRLLVGAAALLFPSRALAVNPYPSPLLLTTPSGGGGGSATFVGVTTAATEAALSFPSGWAAGDMAIIQAMAYGATPGPTPDPPSGWTSLADIGSSGSAYPYRTKTYYRVLQSGDTGPTISLSLYGIAVCAVYRSATTAVSLTTKTGASGTTQTTSAVSPSGSTKRLIGIATVRDPATSTISFNQGLALDDRAGSINSYFSYAVFSCLLGNYGGSGITVSNLSASFDYAISITEID